MFMFVVMVMVMVVVTTHELGKSYFRTASNLSQKMDRGGG